MPCRMAARHSGSGANGSLNPFTFCPFLRKLLLTIPCRLGGVQVMVETWLAAVIGMIIGEAREDTMLPSRSQPSPRGWERSPACLRLLTRPGWRPSTLTKNAALWGAVLAAFSRGRGLADGPLLPDILRNRIRTVTLPRARILSCFIELVENRRSIFFSDFYIIWLS